MEIDSTTLGDLEIFEAAGGRAGVFELIARTTTSAGRSALRRRVSSPFSDISEIQRTQQAVEFLTRHPDMVVAADAEVSAVAKYLRSNITPAAGFAVGARLERLWWKLRYRDVLDEIETGAHATVKLFESIAKRCATLQGANAPALLSEMAACITGTAEDVLRVASRSSTLLAMDRSFRSSLKPRIEEALRQIGELDALNAMALTTSTMDWIFPEVVESDTFLLEAEGLHHPFLTNPVCNPVRLSGGEPMVFLTGPNMAGKTTYLRSVALAVLLAQIGMGIPASSARLSPAEVLFTSLNPSDNLRAGLSYFFAEVLRVRDAATQLAAGKRALIIFDEVFKGTNVHDALDASTQVILGFAKARRSAFIFSSHLVELVNRLESEPSIRYCCFDAEMEHGIPRYSFRLGEGVSDRRFGLLLLKQAQVPELIARIAAAS